jgi:hypothetical protein
MADQTGLSSQLQIASRETLPSPRFLSLPVYTTLSQNRSCPTNKYRPFSPYANSHPLPDEVWESILSHLISERETSGIVIQTSCAVYGYRQLLANMVRHVTVKFKAVISSIRANICRFSPPGN